jgi:sterol desaturase/sphingolipid hydroxylase (fatty acid hydroxylase superfamily)
MMHEIATVAVAAPPAVVPPRVAAFREQYRANEIPRGYQGWVHFALTTTGALAVIVFAVLQVRAPSAAELVTPLGSFFTANLGEYLGHRGPMHNRGRLRILHERHSRRHHRFYTHDAMPAESSRDFHMVLFPPVMLLFFLGALAVPIGVLLFLLVSANVGWMFVATAMAYFLTYEWLHLAYHLPESSWVGRLPGLGALRRHHTLHHDQAVMGECNFNITFPICDLLFGTYRR